LLCSFALNRRLLDQLASFQDERFLAFANQNRQLIEIARCAPAIKVNRAVPAMLRRFRRATALSTQADSVLERFKQRRQDLLGAVASMQQTLFLAVGVLLLVKGDISIGQFVAVGMLKEICLFGMQEVQDALSDLANVRVAMGRVHEIANAPATPQASLQFSHGQAGVDLEIRDLAFRYTAFDPFVFEHLSIHVRAGESVAITGPSGSGKSTLASVIVGSLEPTHGAVLIDGKAIDGSTTETARSIMGTVMQFDHLIAGSIEENIRFFRKISDDEVREAARIACLDHFVNGLPMRYQTLVSDDHPAISGGQRQRILIARAIVGRPRLLIMDEATSFLDVETERRVSQEISRLQCTKVMFAHRMETISSADRVVRLQDVMEFSELVA
jgi:ATP-binding cassette subfamily B protein RaxB